MAGAITLEDLKESVATGDIDTVIAAQVDMQGRLMGKRFQAEFFLDSAWAETHGCNYLLATDLEMSTVPGYAASSWAAGYGDYTMRPDLSTLRRIPWLPGTALCLCDTLDHHGQAEIAHAPRTILKGQIARLAALGAQAMTATELEFYLFRETYEEARARGYRGLTPVAGFNADYAIQLTSREEDVMRAVRTGLNGADIPVEGSKGEANAGQEEINVRYAGALLMADRHAIMKNGVKEIAHARGRSVTFLAKPATLDAGSSAHVHLSLRGPDGAALFHDPAAPHGMSAMMRAFLAGLIAHADAITYFLAPYVNSYKRFTTGLFAPTKTVWSLDNRTAGFRVVGDGTPAVRIECRIGGADLNAHLALAALIAAGLDGVARGLALPPAYGGDAYGDADAPEVPKDLRAAADALDASAMLRAGLGDAVVDHYVRAARWEQSECDRAVTDWDLARGFERI